MVSAINLHQVVVKFSQAVDKTTAERTSNYTGLSGVDRINSAVLQADKQTVVLNLFETDGETAALAQDTDYTLTVEKVQNEAKTTTVAKTEKTFTANDSTIPTVKSVEVLGNKALRLTFSEPVKATAAQNNANYTFVGETVTLGAVDLDEDGEAGKESYTVAIVNLTTSLTPGDHKFRVNGTGAIQDFAGYTVVPQDFTFTYTADVAAPQVTGVQVTSRTAVLVTFSEAVNSLAAADVIWNTNGSLTSGTAADGITRKADNQFELSFANNPLPVSAGYIVVKNDNVVDYSGNKMAAASKNEVTVSAESKPTVTSVNAKDDKTIEIFFSKTVKSDGSSSAADYEANYTLMKADGTVLTNSDNASIDAAGHPTNNVVWNSTEKKATIDLGANALSGATYKVKVVDIKDLIGQEMDDVTVDFTVTDKTAPTYSSYSASASKLIVKFSEPMKTSGENSITDSANYKVSLGGAAYDSFPSGTTFEAASDAKSVTITLPTGKSLTTNDDVKIGFIDGATVRTVADTTGNLLVPYVLADFTVSTAKVDISSSSTLNITSPTTLELTLPDAARKLSSVTNNDFKVTKTAAANFAAAEVTVESVALDSKGKKITFTISESNKFKADDQASVTLYVDPTAANIDSKDELGLKLAESVSKGVDNNKISPALSAVALIDNDTVRVTLDSKIESSELAALESDLIIVQGDKSYSGSTQLTIATLPAATDSQVVDVNLDNSATLDLAQAITVKTVSQDLIDSHGANGAVLAANTTGITTVAGGMSVNTIGFTAAGAAAVKASVAIADLTYTADAAGVAGNAITITYADPGAASQALSVNVVGNAITVNLATDAGSAITSTANQIKTAIDGSVPAAALVDVAVTGTGANVQAAVAVTNLANGTDTVAVAGTTNIGDQIVITFNRNVDAGSIIKDWNGTSKSVSDLVKFDNAKDEISFNGANIGTIKTAGLDADAQLNGTIVVNGNTITITISEAGAVTQSAGVSVFTPSASIKSTSGTAIDSGVKAATDSQV